MTLRSQSQSQPRRLSTCHRHPAKPVTGFCAACLTERLAGIDPETRHELPISNRFVADLRRSKSFSAAKLDSFSGIPEPRRKSCDVGARSTLWDLFNVDDGKNCPNRKFEVEIGSLGFELREEDENEEEIRDSEEVIVQNANANDRKVEEFQEFEEGYVELRTMKEFIDLEWQSKKHSGKDFKRFWVAASVFSKKLSKWRRKEKKKPAGGQLVDVDVVERANGKDLRETQSEVGGYGTFGRRSCDTDQRLSVDARISVDDSRYSFDEPRASWDGYLIGRSYPRLTPMVSVVEDVKVDGNGVENKVLVEEKVNLMNEEDKSPGGSAQTRDYYSEQKRRWSFDHSGSNGRAGGSENAKVSPETVGLFHGAKLLVTEKELRASNRSSLKDYRSESIQFASKDVAAGTSGINQKGFKKSRRWRNAWNIWGLMQRRSESKCGDEEKYIGGHEVDKPLAESWQKLRRVANGEGSGAISQKLIRSYSVSSSSPCKMAGLFHNMAGVEANANGNKRREDLVLQQNRSARYSPNNLDNGLLRFYLTPLRSYKKNKSGKSRLKNSHSIDRIIL